MKPSIHIPGPVTILAESSTSFAIVKDGVILGRSAREGDARLWAFSTRLLDRAREIRKAYSDPKNGGRIVERIDDLARLVDRFDRFNAEEPIELEDFRLLPNWFDGPATFYRVEERGKLLKGVTVKNRGTTRFALYDEDAEISDSSIVLLERLVGARFGK